MRGELFGRVVRANGSILDLGKLGSRVVTTAGVNYMRDDFNAAAGGADITNFKFHAMGTGSVAEAIGDVALGGEVESRVTGTQVGTVSKVYTTVATITATAQRLVREHGLFSASTGGTLWDRTVFALVTLETGDSFQFSYNLTINDGN